MASQDEPKERRQTIRDSLCQALTQETLTARELSARVHISEKEVAVHLEHLRKSLKARGLKLAVTPSECMGCGYRFEKRTRLTRPGRCPACAAERVTAPLFHVASL